MRGLPFEASPVRDFTKPWEKRIGVGPTDAAVCCILVGASSMAVAARLVGERNAIVFSLPGQEWTKLLVSRWIDGLPARLSQDLGDVVAVNYDAEGEGYELIAAGRTVERYVSGVDGARAPSFTLVLRRVDDVLLEDGGAYVPDAEYGYFFSGNRFADMNQRRGARATVTNDGQVLVLGGGREVRHVPRFERVDFA